MAAEIEIPYPRRRVIRAVLHTLSGAAFRVVSNLKIVGQENLPRQGPLLVVANHFSFLDPAMMVSVAPWPMEFLGGFRMPNAPMWATIFPRLWGIFAVYRGGNSRTALLAAENVLRKGGVVGIYPEATSSAAVLRSARPGAAFLAARTGVPVLPVGFDGLVDVFPRLRMRKRAHVTVRIGKLIGPFHSVEGADHRQQLDSIGHVIMQSIAQLIPMERRGRYASDEHLRIQAEALDVYHYDKEPEH
ncbi:MAG: lysophospholipid acyltransferase family protein [Anaerolineae bacterium]